MEGRGLNSGVSVHELGIHGETRVQAPTDGRRRHCHRIGRDSKGEKRDLSGAEEVPLVRRCGRYRPEENDGELTEEFGFGSQRSCG